MAQLYCGKGGGSSSSFGFKETGMKIRVFLVSAPDLTHGPLANRLMHMYTYLETLQECWSRRRIGWIIQDFWETFVSRFLMFLLETKRPWRQTPPRKKKAVSVYKCEANAYQSQLKAGFSEVCEKCKVCGIIFLNYIREFHTRVLLLWWHFHAQKRDAEQNELWLVVWHVGQTASWAGLGQWMQPYVPDLQQSVWSVSASTQNRHFLNYIIIYLWGILSWNFTDTFCPTWDLYYIL